VTSDEEPTDVLVSFDGSDEADRALSYALEQYPDTEITALYVAYPSEELTTTDPDSVPDALDDWEQRLDEQTQEVLDHALDHAKEKGQTISTDAVTGEPADGIVEYVAEHDSDHIVMGSHGRGGLRRLLLGSVAETVTRRAPTSVTVVR
jgi:nucleotide-binding universal stress UspA family protein